MGPGWAFGQTGVSFFSLATSLPCQADCRSRPFRMNTTPPTLYSYLSNPLLTRQALASGFQGQSSFLLKS